MLLFLFYMENYEFILEYKLSFDHFAKSTQIRRSTTYFAKQKLNDCLLRSHEQHTHTHPHTKKTTTDKHIEKMGQLTASNLITLVNLT